MTSALAGYLSAGYSWLAPHSGQQKGKLTVETKVLAQKYFLDGQLLARQAGHGGHHGQARGARQPAGWLRLTTHAEMEVGFSAGTGLS